MLATVRPDEWNLPLLVHVAGAMALVGALTVVIVLMAGALRRGEGIAELARLAYRALLLGVLPAFVMMRGGAEWIASEQGRPDGAWIGIGSGTADGSLLLLVVAIVLARRAARRGDRGPGGAGRAVVVLSGVMLLAYAVAVWAMTAKPA